MADQRPSVPLERHTSTLDQPGESHNFLRQLARPQETSGTAPEESDLLAAAPDFRNMVA